MRRKRKTGGFYMTALQLNADIYRNLGIIAEDESMLKRVAKYVQKLAKQMTALKKVTVDLYGHYAISILKLSREMLLELLARTVQANPLF